MNRTAPMPNPEQIDAAAAAWIARRDAGLTAAEQIDFDEWKAGDPLHARALDRFDTLWSALGRPRRTGASSELQHELHVLKQRQRRRRLSVAGAAMLVFVVLGGFIWRVARIADRENAGGAPAIVMLPESRTLPDGTKAELSRGTEMAVDFSDAVRRVAVKRGEAHFEVVKNSGRPFVVDAGGVEVRAVGTAFAVHVAHAAVEVLVTEGCVAVDQAATVAPQGGAVTPPSASRNLAMVDAGSRVVVPAASTSGPMPAPPVVVVVPELEMTERLAWRSPRVEFSGVPLAKVVALLNRHNRLQFVIEDSRLNSTALSGLFRIDDTEAFVRMLERGFGVKAEKRGGQIFLRKDG